MSLSYRNSSEWSSPGGRAIRRRHELSRVTTPSSELGHSSSVPLFSRSVCLQIVAQQCFRHFISTTMSVLDLAPEKIMQSHQYIMENLDLLEGISFHEFLDLYLPVIDGNEQPPPIYRLSQQDAEYASKSLSLQDSQHDMLKTFVSCSYRTVKTIFALMFQPPSWFDRTKC